MTLGTAEDDRVLPKTKNPYFLENYFTIVRNPPAPNALKFMKSRKFFTHFEKKKKIPMNFHQNSWEKQWISLKKIIKTCWFFRKILKINIFKSNSSFFVLILMKIYRNFNDFFECVKNFRDFINFNTFGVGGVAKNGEIIFEKAKDFSS